MNEELQKAIDLVCLNCTQDTLSDDEICKKCPVRLTVDDLNKNDANTTIQGR